MRRRWRSCGLVAILAAGVATGWAQPPSDSPPGPAEARPLSELNRNDLVRLQTLGERCLEGGFVALLPSRRLRLDVPNGNVRLDSIAGLWVRERQVRRGALWGAGVGLLVGALAAWSEDDVRYAIYGPFVGGFTGGVIAIPSEKWRPISVGTSTLAAPPEPCDPQYCFACLLAGLDRGTPIRVQGAGGMVEGKVERTSEAGFTLATEFGSADVARDDIQRLWSFQPATKQGTKVGVLIGAPVGAVLIGLLAAGFSQGYCTSDCPSALGAGLVGAGVGALLGGFTGALIGGVAGSTTETWVEIPRGVRRDGASADP